MAQADQTAAVNSVLKGKLKHIGYDYDLLTAKQQKYLLAIEEVVAEIFQREKDALEMMAGNNINIKRIASDIGVTRDTIYNNQILRAYIDYRAAEFKKMDVSSQQNELSEENTRLRAEVAALHSRDVDYEETKLQLADALSEIERLKQQLDLAQSGTGFGILRRDKQGPGHVIQLHPKNCQKIVSWNVNGLSSCADKGFFSFVQAVTPDVLCLQETRIDPQKAETLSVQGYELYWNHAVKKGYSGTAIFTRETPIRVIRGLGIDRFDNEGRVITAEFKDFYLVNCYAPASQEEANRLQYRMDFDDAIREYIRVLDATKPVILSGDFNVAHEEIDVETPFPGTITGISPEEREKFDELLETGYDDAFRLLYPDTGHVYSWWPYTDRNRKKNTGLRLDYFLTSERLRKKLNSVSYRTDIMGSDHCPVILDMKL